MKTYKPLISFLIVFALGFFSGVLFSAWKIDTAVPTTTPKMSKPEPDHGNELSQIKSRIAGLEKMAAAKPDDVNVLIQLGNDYFDTDNHEKAIEAYSKALALAPKNADVITDMGTSYRKTGRPQEAVKAFRKALEVDPDHAMAMFNLGIVLRDDMKDDAGALEVWEKFLEKAPNSPHSVMLRPWVKQLKEKLGKSGTEAK